jgi:transposase
VHIRVKLENEIRGLLRTFGVLFGKAVGGFSRRAGELVAGELGASPVMRRLVETLMHTRAAVLDQVKVLDRELTAIARVHPVARLFMTAPGVGTITALSVASAFDQAERFRRSSSAGAYLGLTPRRYESGEVSRAGEIAKHGSSLTRKHLYEATTTLLTRDPVFQPEGLGRLAAQNRRVQKARVTVARKLTSCSTHVEDAITVPLG